MDYKSMNSFLLITVIVLVVLLYLINMRRESFDNHVDENDMDSSMNPMNNNTSMNNINESENNINESENNINEFDLSIESMFKNLEKAEQYCDDMESRQSVRENEERKKVQEIAKQQFEVQQRKIKELKRVVDHLKKQQNFKSKIRNKCQAATQFELNKDTQAAKILAEGGLLDKQKTTLEVNVSDNLKKILKDKPPYNRSNSNTNTVEGFTTQHNKKATPPRYSYDACPSVDTDKYVHISQIANKCYGVNPYALIEMSNYIKKDFE
jgi:hypothetical protein